ncbi:MAG TPA: SLBB domain-containing protein, partial [Nitrospiria bacterium]|nr:SLBB domain-containing protein [Nitrospiria bacterium]
MRSRGGGRRWRTAGQLTTWVVLLTFMSTTSYSATQSPYGAPQSPSQMGAGASPSDLQQRSLRDLIPPAQTFIFAGRTYPAIQALTKPIDPETYLIGPGDGLQVQIWGGVDLLYEVIVTAEGKIVIPTLGTLEVKGQRLREVQELVAREAAKYYRGANTAVTLAVLRLFELFVLGEVNSPGVYPATPVTRLSEMIERANGIAPGGSPRRIEIRKPGGEVTAVNLSRFLEDGVLEDNPFVSDGVTLYVPLNAGSVMIEGAVQRPGTYKLVVGDTVGSIITAAGGLTGNAGGKIYLAPGAAGFAPPFGPVKEANTQPAGAEAKNDQPVRDGDRITIPAKDGTIAPMPVIEDQVYVVGHVKNPGAIPYIRNRSIMDYVGLAGGGDDRAKLSDIVVYRRNEPMEAATVVAVQPGDIIDVPEKILKWWQDYVAILTAVTSITAVIVSAIAVAVAS